tara:strand:- start:537 stop:653 length:117 start_codon:yes stop_codon:yes gene_type:complete
MDFKTWSEDNFAVLALWRTVFSFAKVIIAIVVAVELLS